MRKGGFWKYFLWIVIIVFLFTIIDYIIHASIEYLEIYYYPIPASLKFISDKPLVWYAFGKFYGTIILGLLCYPLLKRIKSNFAKSIVLTTIVVILLEVRYILSGYYTWTWHLANFANHFIALFVVSYIVFSKEKVFR